MCEREMRECERGEKNVERKLRLEKTSSEDQNLGLFLEPKINAICFKKLWLQKKLSFQI